MLIISYVISADYKVRLLVKNQQDQRLCETELSSIFTDVCFESKQNQQEN